MHPKYVCKNIIQKWMPNYRMKVFYCQERRGAGYDGVGQAGGFAGQVVLDELDVIVSAPALRAARQSLFLLLLLRLFRSVP